MVGYGCGVVGKHIGHTRKEMKDMMGLLVRETADHIYTMIGLIKLEHNEKPSVNSSVTGHLTDSSIVHCTYPDPQPFLPVLCIMPPAQE